MSEFIFTYVVCANAEEATRIGKSLVEERLVACVNILPAIQSVYWWEEKITQSTEIAFIAKTLRTKFNDVQQKVLAMHSYDTPCIVALSVEEGNEKYLQWIKNEVR